MLFHVCLWINLLQITGFENISSTPPDLHNKLEYGRNIRQKQVNDSDSNMKSQQLSLCTPSQAAPHTQQTLFNKAVSLKLVTVNNNRNMPFYITINIIRTVSNYGYLTDHKQFSVTI